MPVIHSGEIAMPNSGDDGMPMHDFYGKQHISNNINNDYDEKHNKFMMIRNATQNSTPSTGPTVQTIYADNLSREGIIFLNPDETGYGSGFAFGTEGRTINNIEYLYVYFNKD